MLRALIPSFLLLAFALPTFAQTPEDPTKDLRNHPAHFNPIATLSDDTIQWLMIQRLARKMSDEKLAALGKIQLAFEKSVRDFEEKHAKEVNEIVTAFGNTVRMPAAQRDPLMRKFLAMADQLPDAEAFQKAIVSQMSIDEAAPFIKFLRDRRPQRVMLFSISAGILEETTLTKESQAKILARYEPAEKKAYPYRSTEENIQQWVREQSQRADVKFTEADIAKLDRLLAWTLHRRLQVLNEALLALRVELPKEEFAKFESFLMTQGQWRVRKFEEIRQPPPPPAKADVPEDEREQSLSAIAIPPGNLIDWVHEQDRNTALPKAVLDRLKQICKEYQDAAELFVEQHNKAQINAVVALEFVEPDDKAEMERHLAALLALGEKLPSNVKFQRSVLSLLTAEQAAPLTKRLRERRQVAMAVLELGAGITAKNLDVPQASKEKIENELRDMAGLLSSDRSAFEKLEDWRMKKSPTAAKTIEAMREDTPISRQLNWLMLSMIDTVDSAMSLLEDEIPEADFARFYAKALEQGAKLVEPLDPKPRKE